MWRVRSDETLPRNFEVFSTEASCNSSHRLCRQRPRPCGGHSLEGHNTALKIKRTGALSQEEHAADVDKGMSFMATSVDLVDFE